MWEDVCTIIPLCFHANKIAYVSEPLYHYIHYNTGSYITCMSQFSLNNLIEALASVEMFLEKQQVYYYYADSLCFMKLTVKLNLLLGSKGEQQKNGINFIRKQIFIFGNLLIYLFIGNWVYNLLH